MKPNSVVLGFFDPHTASAGYETPEKTLPDNVRYVFSPLLLSPSCAGCACAGPVPVCVRTSADEWGSAYEPRALFSNVHSSPADAVAIFRDVRARRALAMHWGCVLSSSPPSPALPPSPYALIPSIRDTSGERLLTRGAGRGC